MTIFATYIRPVQRRAATKFINRPGIALAKKKRRRSMTHVTHLADQNSASDGRLVGIITTLALVLAGFLSVISFAAV
jgi:hypothetical protein